MLSRVREGGIEVVGLKRRGRGMGDGVGFVGERNWGLEREGVRRRCRCHPSPSLSGKVMSAVTVIFFCVSLARRP